MIPTTIINARVKQKIATDAYWLSVDDELGPILAGEMALVYDDDGNAVNFKVGDGTKKYSELPFFIAYFNNVTNCKVLSYIDQSANLTIPLVFRNQSDLAKLIFINNSGSEQTIKLGTTDGGSEIGEIVVPNDIVNLEIGYLFTSSQTLYITGLTGVNYSMFILYYQLDEAPVIPSGGGGGITKRYVPGDIYAFVPRFVGHTEQEWDLITGYGRVGTDHEGCELVYMPETYLRGYKTGDVLGSVVKQNEKYIEFENLPELEIKLPSNGSGAAGSGGLSYNKANDAQVPLGVLDGDGNPYSGQIEFDVSPKSKIVLYFTGILTT